MNASWFKIGVTNFRKLVGGEGWGGGRGRHFGIFGKFKEAPTGKHEKIHSKFHREQVNGN